MNQFINLFRYELRMLMLSPASYIAAIIFLFITGFLYLFILQSYNQTPQTDLSTTELFRSFWIPVFFLVPLLTMKSISEERRLGTLETLLTIPLSPLTIVLSKFFSTYVFYLLIWITALFYPFIVEYFIPSTSFSPTLFDSASLIGGFSFIAISGTLYLSIGIFASSLTRNQLVAGLLSFILLFIIIISGPLLLESSFLQTHSISATVSFLNYFETFKQLDDFSRGIVDTRPFFFYVGNSILMLGLTSLVIKSKV